MARWYTIPPLLQAECRLDPSGDFTQLLLAQLLRSTVDRALRWAYTWNYYASYF